MCVNVCGGGRGWCLVDLAHIKNGALSHLPHGSSPGKSLAVASVWTPLWGPASLKVRPCNSSRTWGGK